MKRFYMFILTIIMILLTTGAYFYENSNSPIEYKKPTYNITSSKFGEIKDIKFYPHSRDELLLFILGSNKEEGEHSTFYYLNLTNGKSGVIGNFKPHKYLGDSFTILTDNSGENIVGFSENGVIYFNYRFENIDKGNYVFNSLEKSFDDFGNATSAEISEYNLAFSKKGYSLINNYQLYKNFNLMMDFNYAEKNPYSTIYANPHEIISTTAFGENAIHYTSFNGKSLNLYSHNLDGSSNSLPGKPLVKNVVDVKKAYRPANLFGFYLDETSLDKLQVFSMESYRTSPVKTIDTINFLKDKNGAIPDIQYLWAKGDDLIYTEYDENAKGIIKLKNIKSGLAKDIIKDKNIFGPIRVGRYTEGNGSNGPHGVVLFLHEEEGKTKIALYDIDKEKIIDITEIFF
ncbi:hypothetical protein GCM10008905_24740 [Clostridium malenominatum]|uniref:Lipoprotein n=1 Tax=Clostridium malenominatum TaxID=1539 RepID=A0ABN1J325_9CLOT